jgi:CIC family chloride channel protein
VAYILLIGGAADPHHDPTYVPIFASGYPTVLQALDPAAYAGAVPLTFGVLLALCIAKIAATGFTLGSGGSGGVFAPSLFIGSMTGGALGLILKHLSAGTDPATYALVGMGGMLAAIIQAPLMGIILLFELTRNYQVMLPAMITAISATMTYRALFRDGIYTLPLRRMGVRAGSAVGVATLRRIGIETLPLHQAVIARPDETLAVIIKRLEVGSATDLVVIDDGGQYLGLLAGTDMRTVILAPESATILLVGEVMRTDIPPLKNNATLEAAWDLFARNDVNEAAVVSTDGGRIEGMIHRADVMRRYHQELG